MKSYHLKTSKHFGFNKLMHRKNVFQHWFYLISSNEALVIMSYTKLHFKFLIRSLGPLFSFRAHVLLIRKLAGSVVSSEKYFEMNF